MRIWVVGRAIPTKENNMKGSFELEQAQMLSRHGYEVYYPVLDLRPVRKKRKYGFIETELDGVTAVTLSVPISLVLPGRVRKGLALFLKEKLFRDMAIKYGMPKVIHVHYPAAFSYKPFQQMKKLGSKIVCTEHWTKVLNKTLNEVSVENLKEYIENCDEVMCVGEGMISSIQELTGSDREIKIIPNIVSEDFKLKEFPESDGTFRFAGVGRLVPCKRFDLLIRAFIDEFKGDNRFHLDIIGNGEEYLPLKHLIHEHGCENQISLLGVMDRKEVAEYYHKCNALVMSSNLETFGVPIIEAMASGLPVITTDAMGFPSLFHKEHGYIIPKDDQVCMAKAMRTLYENYSQFDGKKISEYARKYFGEDAIFELLSKVYTAE